MKNGIQTSKYNLITFIPKNLSEQFLRLANFYFLTLVILQLCPVISPLNPLTTMFPLTLVITLTAVKDAVDDYRRHKNDKEVNNRKVSILRNQGLIDEKWHNVQVGDVIKIESNRPIAADLLLISSSEPYGLCYVETAELDGETNLKCRQSLNDTFNMTQNLKKLGAFDGEIICEPPNDRLNVFEGKLLWREKTFPLDNEKILLRGCTVRNTKWCFGVVIFAGKDTKLMMNSGKTFFKRTSLDRYLNNLIVGIVLFLVAMSSTCSIMLGIWEQGDGQKFRLLLPMSRTIRRTCASSEQCQAIISSMLTFLSYIILMNTVVPISLYVSMEIIRFFHSYFINWDRKMYYEKTDTPARARTSALNDELGQIKYIFSDKTGTLTQNIMTFNKCVIDARLYGETYQDDRATKQVDFTWNKWYDGKFKWTDQCLIDDIVDDLKNNGPLNARGDYSKIQHFWRLMALCHTIMPEWKDDGRLLVYQAQSPDEGALSAAARCLGFVFKSRTQNCINIEVHGREEQYDLLCILDFNNVRKRMSVLVRKNGVITLYTKGADTVIFERLERSFNREKKAITQGYLDKLASEGLRTLCIAYRQISAEFYEQWVKERDEAATAMQNRQEKLDVVYEKIERDLTLLGATAIEDKLQDGVPETIAKLSDAGIKIWVLTGDKQETAVNVGYSCQLLREDMNVFVVDGCTFYDVNRQIDNIVHRRAPKHHDEKATPNNRENRSHLAPKIENLDSESGYAVVIAGQSLTHAMTPQLEKAFLDITCAPLCKSVVCCRVTPIQKAMVVEIVKRNERVVTLAIGDGANDVSMIKTAHLGVGISGQEGMQAVLASDYSIAQFRFLERLLLVHGRWSYYRMCKFLRYFFYKNFAFAIMHFWFSFYCAFSAKTIYEPIFIAFYNLFFTSLPVLVLAIFDQDVDDETSLRHPNLYAPGQNNKYFNFGIFLCSVGQGLVATFTIYFVSHFSLVESINENGRAADDWHLLAFTVFSSLIATATVQIALETTFWTFWNHLVVWGSVILYSSIAAAYFEIFANGKLRGSAYGTASAAIVLPRYWLCIILVATTLNLGSLSFKLIARFRSPKLSDQLRVRARLRASLPLKSLHSVSGRYRSTAVRSGYAFAHQQGFGDLILRGILIKKLTTSLKSDCHSLRQEDPGAKTSSVESKSPVNS